MTCKTKLTYILIAFLISLAFIQFFLKQSYSFGTTKTYYSTVYSGYIYRQGEEYPPATTEYNHINGESPYVEQFKFLTLYLLYRGFLDFDTSNLPDNALIYSVTLTLTVKEIYAGNTFDMKIYSGKDQWTSQATCAWEDCSGYEGIIFNTEGLAVNFPYPMSINTSSVSLTGHTNFKALGNEVEGIEFQAIKFYEYNALTYKPKLEVVYYLPTEPIPSGNLYVYPNVAIKPNTLHTYQMATMKTFNSITFPQNDLRLTRNFQDYQINCATNDNATIDISYWFEIYMGYPSVRFIAIAENLSSLTFNLYTRNYGEPTLTTGTTSESYDNTTSKLSFQCSSGVTVTLRWQSGFILVYTWWWENALVWMGFIGLGMVLAGSVFSVKYAQEHDFRNALIWLLVIIPIGFALIVGWIFA